MDLDADGRDDVITGSYWPGHIYWFRGLGDGEYAEGQRLQDVDGELLHAGKPWPSDDEPDMDSLAAVPCAVDWDGDGDYDLLVGNIAGGVTRIMNVGAADKPVFAKERHPVEAGGKVLRVEGDAGPVQADWDGDGLWDLVVGSDDGSVVWCRNDGSAGAPKLAAPAVLIPESPQRWEEVPAGGEPKGHGVRAKVHVADWNGDGLLDILLGDFVSFATPAPELTPEQEKRRDELRAARDRIAGRITALFQEKRSAGAERKQEIDAEIARIAEEQGPVYQELQALEPRDEPHGFVWVFLQRPREAGRSGVR